MALVINDRVKETTTTTGTGTVSLGGAVTGFETFAAGVGNSNTTYYAIVHQTANEFEVGLGTLDGDSSDLARTTVISSSNSDSAVDFAAGTKDVFCTIPASKLIFEDANNDATVGRNLTVTGDLTVSGDDITMGTNTAGNLLVADGTNFNSIAVGSLSEISSVASDDVLLAVDTSGGGLKKIARSTLVSGLATSSAISNVSEDSTPQLGGNLDLNGNDIVTTSNATIDLAPNGTGTVVVRGNTNSGRVVFNCESNSHGQTLASQPHSAGVTNTLLLPAGANSTLVSLVSTDTLTNKTLTSPKINEDVAVTSTATEINLLDGVTATTAELNLLDGVTATTAELNILDGVTSTAAELNLVDGITAGTVSASKAVIVDSNKDLTGFRNLTISGDLTVSGDDITMGTNTNTAIMVADGTNFNPVVPSGDVSLTNAGVFGIASGVIVNADVNASAAIAMSKTAFVAGTGVSLSTNTLSVDAAQTGITSILATDVKIGEDDETKIDFETADTINFYAGNEKQLILTDGALTPGADNILDLGSSGVEFKDGFFDGTVTADAFAGPLTGNVTGNVSGTAATVTGAAQTNITSLGTLTALTVDNIAINGATIGHTDDTDLITLADGIATVAGEISVTTLDIGGTNVTSTAAELNLLDGVSGLVQADLTKLAAVDATAAELNIMDGGTSATSTTLADADRLVTNDNGTMVQVALSDVKTYLSSAGFSTEDPTALAIALG